MKELRCKKCNCIIPPGAGYYNFLTGAQCSKCGNKKAQILDREMQRDPFGLELRARLNKSKRSKGNGKKNSYDTH